MISTKGDLDWSRFDVTNSASIGRSRKIDLSQLFWHVIARQAIANSNCRLKPDYFVVDPIYFCTFTQRAHLSYDLSLMISRPDLFSSFVTRYFHALLCELVRDGLLAEDNIRRWLSSFLFSQMARHSMLSKGDLNPPFSEIPRGMLLERARTYH